MVLKWTSKALSDLTRLYDFLLPVNKPAAIKAVRALVKAPDILLSNPRIGEQLFQFAPSEVRRILVGQYEMRYEIADDTIYMLRLWHTRERRE
ncbi:type II toxin-antitoxin system RelE/ParE family toxin [Thiolapillus sp.]|uniref:type II toxin-antitoxin system RelE/ParE family toxin n=2 Tax=Thiolapillus sp. TaxID=2017437 RepID=UPI0025EF3ECE|nr:type II toxin-antitoxin system RelE/ParE family toxin [Thiolapillus sp.]